MEGNMAQTKKRSILFVVALAVFAALIVILAATLSACSNDDNDTKEPTPTETAQPEVTTEPASADVSTGKTGDAATTGSMTGSAAKQPTKSPAKSPAKSPIKNGGSSTNNSGSKDNGRNKIDYIMNYGDNVEKGVEGAADDFVGSLKGIGNAYDKGDVEGITNTVDDFSKGLGDFLGGVKDSIIP